MLLALILAASSPTNTVGRFDRTNSRTQQGRSDRGLGRTCSSCVCQNSTNWALQSNAFENGAWSTIGTATITPTDGSPAYFAPDGTNTARLLTVPACPFTQNVIYQLRAVPDGSTAGSVWVRGLSGSISVSLYSTGLSAGLVARCTPVAGAWAQCSVLMSTTSDVYMLIGCNGSPAYSGFVNTGAASAYIWQGQLENNAVATCPISTTTIPVTRSSSCAAVCQ